MTLGVYTAFVKGDFFFFLTECLAAVHDLFFRKFSLLMSHTSLPLTTLSVRRVSNLCNTLSARSRAAFAEARAEKGQEVLYIEREFSLARSLECAL